ncbi:hypothetical protein ACOMHN_007076 [Nucella lapillus]
MKTKIVLAWVVVGVCLLLQTHRSTADDINAGGSQTSSSNNTRNYQSTITAPEASETAVPSADSHENTDETDSSSTETTENDQNADNITGMSNSLADYVLDLLTHSNSSSDQTEEAATAGGNATQASEASSATSGNGGLSSGSAESSTGREGSGAQATSATPDTDKNKGAGTRGHDQWSDNEMMATPKPSVTTTPQRTVTVDCNKEVDLGDYCGFTGPAKNYFNSRTDVEGLRAPFIDMGIVHSLVRDCRRGEWCLDNKLDVFRGMQDRFYEGPMCDDSMWKCIFDVILLRENCLDDGEFLLVVDSMDLLCNLPNKDNPFQTLTPGAEKDETRCFAYVLAALHVTYADLLANNSFSAQEKEVSCQGYGFRMTETYLCADNNCKGQYEARRAMEGFERWSWFMVNENTRMKNCRSLANDTCGPLRGNESTLTKTWFGMTTFAPFWTMTTTNGNGSAEDQSGSGSKFSLFGEDDKSLMVALTVGTAVGLLFIMLGLLFWRRSRRRSAYYYRSLADSYTEKGPSDEARLLGRSMD